MNGFIAGLILGIIFGSFMMLLLMYFLIGGGRNGM